MENLNWPEDVSQVSIWQEKSNKQTKQGMTSTKAWRKDGERFEEEWDS